MASKLLSDTAMYRSALALLIFAGCRAAPVPEAAPSTDGDSASAACGPPVILSPGENEATELEVHLRTQSNACLVATKCYLNGDSTPVASAELGGVDAILPVPSGRDVLQCNGWDRAGRVYLSRATVFEAHAITLDGGTGPIDSVPLAALTAHNTSANAAYDRTHFAANFGPDSWVTQAGAIVPIDPDLEDRSMNPVTPGRVSRADVHTLIPTRPDLRWFAHLTPWFKSGGGNHIDIGLDCNSPAYVQSMLDDVQARGFDGVVIDWYGNGGYVDQVTRLIQQRLAVMPGKKLTFIVMIDKGVPNLSPSVLDAQLQYLRTQYFGDAQYEREAGKPIVLFFGVEDRLGPQAMAASKAGAGAGTYWVMQGPGSLSEGWVDGCFDWTHDWHAGPSRTDPYNLNEVSGFYSAVAGSPKGVFGSMVAGFNGTLTMSVAWSEGKYLPRGSGACMIEWAKRIDQVIPANVTRMQWVTWSDWEEGTEIEAGVENDIRISPAVQSGRLNWTVSGGTGDDSTIDHYQIYASPDGQSALDLGRVASGTHAFDLGTAPALHPRNTYRIYVFAAGKPNIRDHLSAPTDYAP